jgi:hypothetical protein
MSNPDLVLAGTGAGGSDGAALVWVAPEGTAAPTTALTVLGSGWVNAGIISTDGLNYTPSESVKEIDGYGLDAPVRKITTSSAEDFDVVFMESSPTVLELYFRKALASLVPDSSGAVDFTTGTTTTEYFAVTFDIVDGDNHIRIYAPKCQNATRKGQQVQKGEAITYPVTISVLQSSTGIATHRWYVLDALKTA